MKAFVTTLSTYDVIYRLEHTSGVSVGGYEYHLDGEVISGHAYETEDLLKNSEFIPVAKIFCCDGWLYATDYNDKTLIYLI
jgi:hypothetical protein